MLEPFLLKDMAFLKYAYEAPCDVDFGVGASMHVSSEGDLLSDIFDHVFTSQFKRLKCGDPYFYTNTLSQDQRSFVDSLMFRDVLCYSIPNMPPIQSFVFMTPGANNTIEACNGTLDLEGWKLSSEGSYQARTTPTTVNDVFDFPYDPYSELSNEGESDGDFYEQV